MGYDDCEVGEGLVLSHCRENPLVAHKLRRFLVQ